MRVSLQLVERAAKTMKKEIANIATQNLWLTNMQKNEHAIEAVRHYSGIESIVDDGVEDVYCIKVPIYGNFVANGIVVKNCDALRYAVYSAFPQGIFSHPDENISYDQLRRNVFGSDDGWGSMLHGGGGIGGF